MSSVYVKFFLYNVVLKLKFNKWKYFRNVNDLLKWLRVFNMVGIKVFIYKGK